MMNIARQMFGLLSCLIVAMPCAAGDYPVLGKIVRKDARLDSLLPADAKIEVLASGFDWSEGPVWDKNGGYLLFSDVPQNKIYKWSPKEGLSTYMKPSGFTGAFTDRLEPGTNGLTIDDKGRLISCDHGDRRIASLEPGEGKRTLVDNYQGKRLNSPNDLAIKSNGDIYFTDPPYGLRRAKEDEHRELDFCGVYRLAKNGELTLLTKELKFPNGLAFSPDEKTLYVQQSDRTKAIIMAFEVNGDGTLGAERVFFDETPWVKQGLPGLPDGMKVDRDGNVFATGVGGVHVFAADGTHLGTLDTGEANGNCAWGDDGSTLYINADMWLCRVKTTTKGAGW
jgi:gluconolactonase